LVHNGRILLLRRAPDDDRNPNMWDCVGGHFLAEESGEECMIREAREETGLKVKIVKSGRVFEFNDHYGRAIGLPYLLASDSEMVTLTEHVEFLWVRPEKISEYNCVPEIGILLQRFPLSGRNRTFAHSKR
jgi:8-oxo-dGTP diphosphatase